MDAFPAAADAANSSLGASLGLSDPDLDEGKAEGQAISLLQQGRGTKRPKVTHSLFFEDDKGLKKVLKTFPKIRFRGKGSEYEDISLLIQHYKRWFAELYPYGDHFEDIVLKSRQVLEDKEKEDDGTISDPRERLHAFRFQYKNSPPTEDAPARPANADVKLSDEARARIEANRKAAMERKRQREGNTDAAAGGKIEAPQEMDMDELWRIEEEAANKSQGPALDPFGDEEEDPFGYGGGFDDFDGGSKPATGSKPSQAVAPPSFDEEDVFGLGGGFDDEAPAPKAPSLAPAAAVDPEVARRIAENRAKALARKAAVAAAAAAPEAATSEAAIASAASAVSGDASAPEIEAPGAAPEIEAPGAAPMAGGFDEEEPFDFGGGGFDDA